MKTWYVKMQTEGGSWFVDVDIFDKGVKVDHAGVIAETMESALEVVAKVMGED